MPVELIGLISTQDQSETRSSQGPLIDPAYVRRFARAHEDAGFDRVLIGYSSASPDGLQVAAYAAGQTERLGFLIAHRPGFVAPTVAARAFATLDCFSGGRVALHTISGGHDSEQARDGDFKSKDQRYARSREFLQVVKQAWTAQEPFSFEGAFYRVVDYVSEVRPLQQPRIPVYFGGSSPAAYRVGAAEADVFALFAQPLAQIAEEIAAVKAAAEAAGRAEPPRISVSFRPILGATEELAWDRARGILATTQQRIADGVPFRGFRTFGTGNPTAGSQRQLDAAARGERHDRALWTSLAAATGAGGNSTALVGTPETVAEALLDYVDIGVTTLLIRGYDPYDDAIDYGRELIPRVREGVARRERERGAAIGAPAATVAVSA
jgi:alkanesulfonate monooxygenase